MIVLQPLSDAHSFGHEKICEILEAQGGIDPVYTFLMCNIVKFLLTLSKETVAFFYIHDLLWS